MEEEKKYSVCAEIRALANLMRRQFDTVGVCDASALTGGQCYIMGYLAHNRGRHIYQRDIESEFRIRRSTVTRTLQTMERNGLIKRVSDASDARLKRLELTSRALAINMAVNEKIKALERELLCGVSESECAEFIRISEKIRTNAERLAQGGEEC